MNVGLWPNRRTTVGIMIGEPEARGRGYGTEAMRLLVDYAFTAVGLHSVMLWVYEFNAANKLSLVTDRNGNQTQYTYDALNRLIGIDYPNSKPRALSATARVGGRRRMLIFFGTCGVLFTYPIFTALEQTRDPVTAFALVLAARTWVKLNEPRLLARRLRSSEEEFRREQRVLEDEAARLREDEEEEAAHSHEIQEGRLENSSRRFPDKEALVHGDERCSYGDVADRVAGLRHGLSLLISRGA